LKLTFAAFAILAAISCTPAPRSVASLQDPSERITIPASAPASGSQALIGGVDKLFKPRVPISQDDSVIAVYNVNLDLDASEEQILLLTRVKAESPVRIAVVVYDSIIAGYTISYEQETGSTNRSASSLTFVDLIGDHSVEIVCIGKNTGGEQTIEVLRRSVSPTGFGLYYESIFSHEVDGTAAIETVARSEAYREGFSNGASFAIVTLAPPEVPESLLDLIRVRYYWRFAERRYVRGQEELISGKAIEQLQLQELFRSGAESFEEFLRGAWFLESPALKEPVYLFYEPNGRRFTYYSKNIQEVYVWGVTYKTLVNQVELTGVNKLIPYIRKNLYVRVDGIDSIRLIGANPWSGIYRRIDVLQQAGYEQAVPEESGEISLEGVFLSDIGERLFFAGDEFELEWSKRSISGLYSLYSIGTPILELKIREKTGVISENLRFRLEYDEILRDDRLYRTLYIEPGVVGVYGFESTGEPVTRYEQIVRVEAVRQGD